MSRDYDGYRERTNVYAIYFCELFVLILFGFVCYSFIVGDISRVTSGYDDCGNVCGKENSENTIKFCGSNNKVLEKFLLFNVTKHLRPSTISQYDNTAEIKNVGQHDNAVEANATVYEQYDIIVHKKCVARCEDHGFQAIANRCFISKNDTFIGGASSAYSFLRSIAQDLAHSWFVILITCIVALVFSYMLLVLFRYVPHYVIWAVLFVTVGIWVVGAMIFLGIFFQFLATRPPGENGGFAYLIFVAVFLIFALGMAFIIYLYRKRIRLVIGLFKEAGKALIDIPLLVAEPILTFISLGIGFSLYLFVILINSSTGTLTVYNDEAGNFESAEYEPTVITMITDVLNTAAFIWWNAFILGCQHFIIGSAVSDWYFAENKDKLDSPIARGFFHLCNFNLGSVCLGSIFVTIVTLIRIFANRLYNQLKESGNLCTTCAGSCFQYIMELIEALLKYLVSNAYIIVAKDGTPLFESGKKALRLLTKNLIDVIVLNQVGDYVLVLGKVFVTLISAFISYELADRYTDLQSKFFPVLICALCAFFIAHSFMTVFEITVDTVFICFCEDLEINDGVTRPYAMSRKFMETMQTLKQAARSEFQIGRRGNVEAGSGFPMLTQNSPFSYGR